MSYRIIRGAIENKNKYCRIPIRSKTAEMMMDENLCQIDAPTILKMPADKAIRVIDAIVADWNYWMRRAGEFYVSMCAEKEGEPDGKE